MQEDFKLPSLLVLGGAAISALLCARPGTVAPDFSHELECLSELRRINDLLDQVAWWKWLARWLLCCVLCLLVCVACLLGLVTFAAGGTYHLARRCGRRRVDQDEIEALQRRARGRRPPLALRDGSARDTTA